MDFLRDNIWQFVLGFLGIGVTVLIYFLQRRKKSLSYQVVSETPLLTLKEGIERKIKILFEEKPVKNVHLLILRIMNNGDVPILPNDFQDVLRFSFGKETMVLSAELTNTSPKTFKPIISADSNCVVFQPTLLNSGDMATMKLLLAGYDNKIECEARIIGVKDIKRVNESFSLSAIYTLIGMISLITGTVLFSLLVNAWSSYTIANLLGISRFTAQFILYTILTLVGLILVLLRIPIFRIKR